MLSRSPEWAGVSQKEKEKLGLTLKDDGEFWWVFLRIKIIYHWVYLTLIGISSENMKKNSSLEPPRSKFYKIQWAWQGVKLTRLMSIFTSKKVLEIFDTNSAHKIESQNYKRGKSALPHVN